MPLNSPAHPTSSSKKNLDTSNYATVAISDPGANGFDYSPMEATASVAQGMSSQRGNEIDEFVTDGVRNNLLGLPLDLASLNIARGRDVGLPSLNQFRAQHATSLPPYVSWYEFITTGIRHPASGINFLAAYGQDPTILSATTASSKRDAAIAIAKRAIPVRITNAISNGSTIVFTGENSYAVGDHFTVTNIVNYSGDNCNIVNATITSVDPSSFTISSTNTCLHYKTPSINNSGSGGWASYVAKDDADSLTITNAVDFINSKGTWNGKETGLNYVDLWIGGLAEIPAKQPVTPPMLGTTFQYVFKDQMLKLQDGDRFYYLSRLLGTNLFGEIPAQKLTDIVRRNTYSAFSVNSVTNKGIIGMTSPGFGVADCAQSAGNNVVPDALVCKATANASGWDLTNGPDLTNIVLFVDPATNTGKKLQGGAGDDNVQGGAGNDRLSGGISGGDLLSGGAGDDVLLGGAGEDLLNGGSGNDVLNTGDSQFGDIADGGSGNDFIHCGVCQGIVLSFHGESGNDFIQGGSASDLGITGGEGNDWIEGGDGADIMFGDNGTFGNIQLESPQFSGGADVINAGTGLDIPFGGGGDDIFILGIGMTVATGDFGFDWSDNEYATRYDNGTQARPNVWADIGGNLNPNTARFGDLLINVEAISGSAGNDKLFGGVGRMSTTVVASGVAGTNLITISNNNAANANILPGSYVTGSNGSGSLFQPHTFIANVPMALSNCGNTQNNGGNNCYTYRISSAIKSTFTNATITLSVDPLTTPELVTNLPQLINGTPGTTQSGTTNIAWTGGSILLGGEGNDSIFPSDGSDIIHGSAYLHVCIKVSGSVSSAAQAAMNVTCAGGRGFSNMTLLAPFMDSGEINPNSLSIVREILPTSVAVTGISATTTQITFTASHNFYVGERVTVSSLDTALSAYEVNNALVVSTTSNSFTVNKNGLTALSQTAVTNGIAVATDTLDLTGGTTQTIGQAPVALGGLSGPKSQFKLTKFSGTLPSGATYGCTVTDNVSKNVITIFDIQYVNFTDGLVDESKNCGPNATAALVTAPGAPNAPTVSISGNNAIVSWNAPASNGGAAIDGYYISMYDTSSVAVNISAGTCSTFFNSGANTNGVVPSLSCNASGLTVGTPVQFTVTAHNLQGKGLESTKSISVTPGTPVSGGGGGGGSSGSLTITTNPAPSINGNFSLINSVSLITSPLGNTSYTLPNGSICVLHGAVVNASKEGTCTVTATQGTSKKVTGTLTLNFVKADQAALRISNKVTTAKASSSITLTTAGGSGGGAISFSVSGSCTVSANGTLRASNGPTSCAVTATKAGSTLFNPITSTSVTFTFN